MLFSVGGVRCRIAYSFVLMLSFALFSGNRQILYVVLFSSLHETGHLLALILLGGKPTQLTFAYYGIGLKHNSALTPTREILFLMSGVAVNALLALFNLHRDINVPLLLMNALPVYPLDGGRALKTLLNQVLSLRVTDNVFRVIAVICLALLFGTALYRHNVSLLLISLYILVYSVNNSSE